ncbi:hypothetical protein KY289_011624 [Solanum tuberosum]|nr:hypothetical protein KY289_011624 [Solanum tuberosum]
MLMYGYNLFGHLDRTTPGPNRTIALSTNIPPNPAFLPLVRQDKFIQNAFMASIEPTIASTDSHSINEYLHNIWYLSDELATPGALVSNPELIVKILSGLGPEFREMSAVIRACDTTISYEELFEKLLDYELFLRHEDAKKLSSPITTAVATPTKNNTNNRNNCRQTTNSQQWRQNSQPNTPSQ